MGKIVPTTKLNPAINKATTQRKLYRALSNPVACRPVNKFMGRNFVLTPDKKKLRFFCETSETYEDGKPFTCSEDFEIAQNDPDDEGAVDTGLGCDRDEKQVSQAHGSELAAVATEATTTQTVATTLLPQLGSIFSVPCTNCDEVNTLNKEELKLIGRKKFTEHVKQTNNNCFHSTGVVNVNTLWYIYIQLLPFIPQVQLDDDDTHHLLDSMEQFLLTLVRIRQGYDLKFLSFFVWRIRNYWFKINQCLDKIIIKILFSSSDLALSGNK